MRLDLFNCFILKISFIYKSYITKKEIRGGGVSTLPTCILCRPASRTHFPYQRMVLPLPWVGLVAGGRGGGGGAVSGQ